MNKYLYFGEKVEGFGIRVLNEREVRAGAGILFFFAMITFLSAWLTGNFNPTKIFVIAFLIDFFIRIFINPKYSPSLIMGKFAVGGQKVEYVGAPQKRFAWALGFILAITMFFLIIVNNIVGPINLFICLTCLLLLFFESAFGICIGCKIYNLFYKEKAELCPGGSCEVVKKEAIQKISLSQAIITFLFISLVVSIPSLSHIKLKRSIESQTQNTSFGGQNAYSVVTDECQVPDWAAAIGHAEMWKLHHNCK